ncbi:hypothetical protein [Actinomadura hibisca]|uniref:hypothetical protein n=1 Tax=Actinomadura hibisca TaxID=68565 RepID=UPI0008336407|nr:hypothetical protein [Actinomadura hibisca]
MRGDPGSLFDAHAARLHAYCWSLLGDAAAASAVADTFVAAVRHPPRGDNVLWLYALARSACGERGAFAVPAVPPFGTADPLLRAAGSLRADHREALLLEAGEWLEVPDIARVLGIAPDTARQILNAARARLERSVLETLMRGAGDTDLITAFEKGRLPRLLADRAPATAPDWLRERVLAACDAPLAAGATGPLSVVSAPNPLVVIGTGPEARRRPRRGIGKGIGAVAGLAASIAAAVSVLVSWPTAKGVGVSAATPTSDGGRSSVPLSEPAADSTSKPATTPTRDGGPAKSTTPGHDGVPTSDEAPEGTAPPASPADPGLKPPPAPSDDGGERGRPAKPPKDDEPSRPPTSPAKPPETEEPTEPAPTTPPETEEPTTPPPPTTPEEPTEPPVDEPAPSPTNNPDPTPQS